MAEKNKKLHKVTMTTNLETQEVRVGFSPRKGSKITNEDAHVYLNTILSGAHVGMLSILSRLPVLRPATPEERDLNVYIFKDEERDNALYTSRKHLYNGLVEAFNRIINEAFPDIEYIENTREYQQEFVFEKTDEEVDEFHRAVQELSDKIKSEDDKPVEKEEVLQ